MAKKILILYSSVDGHTKKICQRIAQVLEQKGRKVESFGLGDFYGSLEDYPHIILACSIRYGKHHPHFLDFVQRNAKALNESQSVFISVNLVARKPEKASADTNPYVRKFLSSIAWKPDLVGVFAGRLDYPRYPWWDRLLIQAIMWITDGPTDPKTQITYTDWDRVDGFGNRLLEHFG